MENKFGPTITNDNIKEIATGFAKEKEVVENAENDNKAEEVEEDIEKAALEHENSAKWMEGKSVKKIIVVPKKIVNIVIG